MKGSSAKFANKNRSRGKLTGPFWNWDGGSLLCHDNWDEIRAGPHTLTELEGEMKREGE